MTEKEVLPEESFVLNTRFGSRTIAHSKLITMPHGMPGFDQLRRFALLNLSKENNDGSFKLLQSVDDAEVAFFVLPIGFDNSLIEAQDLHDIATSVETAPEHAGFLIVVTIRTYGHDNRAPHNGELPGPIIINTQRCQAWQVVIDDGKYAVQHPLTELGA